MNKKTKILFWIMFCITPQFILLVAVGGWRGLLIAPLMFLPYWYMGRMYEIVNQEGGSK